MARKQLPRKTEPDKPKVIPTILDHVPRGTKQQRLKKAIANDNGGQWFLASSKFTAAQLERRFRGGAVGHVLYERIGGLLQGPYEYIYIQIDLVTSVIDGVDFESKEEIWKTVRSYSADECWPEWGVEFCLREIGIEIEGAVPDISVVLKSGQY